jgi:hypothetical protein
VDVPPTLAEEVELQVRRGGTFLEALLVDLGRALQGEGGAVL